MKAVKNTFNQKVLLSKKNNSPELTDFEILFWITVWEICIYYNALSKPDLKTTSVL